MLKLNVLTPERKAVVDLDVTQVTVPAYSGEMTILPGHAPLVTTLGTGIIKYKVGADKMYKALISSGYCEVTPTGVNVLAEFMHLGFLSKKNAFDPNASHGVICSSRAKVLSHGEQITNVRFL